MTKRRAAYAIVLVIFVWVSLTGCSAVVGGIERMEKGVTVERPVKGEKLELSHRYWDPMHKKHYRIDKATGKRLYENLDTEQKKWFVVDDATGERIYLPDH